MTLDIANISCISVKFNVKISELSAQLEISIMMAAKESNRHIDYVRESALFPEFV